jgi:hypothetical protein
VRRSFARLTWNMSSEVSSSPPRSLQGRSRKKGTTNTRGSQTSSRQKTILMMMRKSSLTRCREPPDNPTIPEDIEPPQAPAQQENSPGADADDYAFGIIFSSLHDVRRHFTNLVVKGLINLTKAREQTARYDDLFWTMRQEEFLHPIRTSHLRHLHASARLEVLTDEAQDTPNPLDVKVRAPEGHVNHAAGLPLSPSPAYRTRNSGRQ